MNKYFRYLLILLISLTLPGFTEAMASSSKKPRKRSRTLVAKKRVKMSKKRSKRRYRSKAPRTAKPIALGFRGGNVMAGLLGFGGEAMFHANRSNAFGVAAYTGEMDLTSSVQKGPVLKVDHMVAKSYLITGQYRHFIMGSSFHVTPGIGYRMVTTEVGIVNNDATTFLDLTTSSSSFTGQVALGNLWYFGNIYLGVDWLGYGLPLTTDFGSSVDAEQGVDGSYNVISETAEDIAYKLGTMGMAQLLVVNVGLNILVQNVKNLVICLIT